jgi:hypothetical protein
MCSLTLSNSSDCASEKEEVFWSTFDMSWGIFSSLQVTLEVKKKKRKPSLAKFLDAGPLHCIFSLYHGSFQNSMHSVYDLLVHAAVMQ